MVNKIPNIDPKAVFNVKQTCKILGICKDTLRDRRSKGLIIPINHNSNNRLKYSGAAIRQLWKLENLMP